MRVPVKGKIPALNSILITQLRQPKSEGLEPNENMLICIGVLMTRNKVQFQKGMSEAQFEAAYGTEDLCHAALVSWRWPEGFEGPGCEGRRHCIVKRGGRILYHPGS